MTPRSNTARTVLAVLALAGLTLAACGSDDPGSTPEPVDDTAAGAGSSSVRADSSSLSVDDLDGRTFVSTEVTGHELVEDSEIKVTFLADAMSVNAGCNTMNGGFQLAEGVLTAGPLAMTMMACDQPLMDQDTWLAEFLGALPTVGLDGTTLTLAGDDTTITMSELQPSPLEDTVWNVTGTVSDEAVSSVPADSSASITIAADGTVSVNAGCNTGAGSVEVTDATLTFGDIATTMMMCEPELMELETSVLAVLSGEVSYEINGDNLSLRSGDGADAIGLELTAAS